MPRKGLALASGPFARFQAVRPHPENRAARPGAAHTARDMTVDLRPSQNRAKILRFCLPNPELNWNSLRRGCAARRGVYQHCILRR